MLVSLVLGSLIGQVVSLFPPPSGPRLVLFPQPAGPIFQQVELAAPETPPAFAPLSIVPPTSPVPVRVPLKPAPVSVVPSEQRVATVPAPIVRQWIYDTSRPGWQCHGRIVNGWLVDVDEERWVGIVQQQSATLNILGGPGQWSGVSMPWLAGSACPGGTCGRRW